MIQKQQMKGPRTGIKSKVIKTQNGELLVKHGYAYFPFRSIQKSKISENTKKLLNSYPCWFLKDSFIYSTQFLQVAKHITAADPKEIYFFQQKQKPIFLNQKSNILSSIDDIKFNYLKIIHIMLGNNTNFQPIQWINAPLLEEIDISTQGAFTSLKPLEKSNFKNLLIINIKGLAENRQKESRMFDLSSFHRTRFLNYKSNEPPKAKIYTPPGSINICRKDLSNISYFAKMQIKRLTNFHIPHLQMANNQKHRFTPNAQYQWCPQIQFSQAKLYKTLNNRFDNKTVALSISDYMFEFFVGEENAMENLNRIRINNNNPENQIMDQEQYEIDSDIDGPIELDSFYQI